MALINNSINREIIVMDKKQALWGMPQESGIRHLPKLPLQKHWLLQKKKYFFLQITTNLTHQKKRRVTNFYLIYSTLRVGVARG